MGAREGRRACSPPGMPVRSLNKCARTNLPAPPPKDPPHQPQLPPRLSLRSLCRRQANSGQSSHSSLSAVAAAAVAAATSFLGRLRPRDRLVCQRSPPVEPLLAVQVALLAAPFLRIPPLSPLPQSLLSIRSAGNPPRGSWDHTSLARRETVAMSSREWDRGKGCKQGDSARHSARRRPSATRSPRAKRRGEGAPRGQRGTPATAGTAGPRRRRPAAAAFRAIRTDKGSPDGRHGVAAPFPARQSGRRRHSSRSEPTAAPSTRTRSLRRHTGPARAAGRGPDGGGVRRAEVEILHGEPAHVRVVPLEEGLPQSVSACCACACLRAFAQACVRARVRRE